LFLPLNDKVLLVNIVQSIHCRLGSDMELKNKVAVVTGGSSGLGNATVLKLVSEGVSVAVFDVNQQAGEKVVAQLRSDFGSDCDSDKAIYCNVDVRSDDSVQAAIDQVIDKWGAIHICVNCAGIAPAKRVLNREGQPIPLEDFQNVININLTGTFNVSRLVAAAMAKNQPSGEANERGVIVNTASVAGCEGQVGQAAYAASKGAILALNLPMARDLAPLGIRVNAIAPGTMGTPMLLGMPEKVQESLVADIQFPKRLGLPSEYADLCTHIIENAYINGETIRLDGALRMPPK